MSQSNTDSGSSNESLRMENGPPHSGGRRALQFALGGHLANLLLLGGMYTGVVGPGGAIALFLGFPFAELIALVLAVVVRPFTRNAGIAVALSVSGLAWWGAMLWFLMNMKLRLF